ncbi:MAG: ATP-binding protein, partial [Desulfovibrionaceae bacterium]
MSRVSRVLSLAWRPRFFGAPTAAHYSRFTSYTRMYVVSLVLLSCVSLVPLSILAAIDYKLTEKSLVDQTELRLIRVTSNTRRSVGYFFEERVSALRFAIEEETYAQLSSSSDLESLLRRLKIAIGGLIDLGLIDSTGRQVAYAGPFHLQGRDYSGRDWFKSLTVDEAYVSEVSLGFRNTPHIAIAVKAREGEKTFILRATIDTTRLVRMLTALEMGGEGDAFLINRDGVLQTPAVHEGDILQKLHFAVPPFSERTSNFNVPGSAVREPLLVGYAYITQTPFILLMVKNTGDLMHEWSELRLDLLGFLIISVFVILVVIYFISTYMINNVYESDLQQAKVMQHMEDTNRLASIGRLAAGVAHEINNPLAIINMKAGLIKDMFELKKEYQSDEKLMDQINAVIHSVERCGLITKQLLGFAREVELNVQDLDIEATVLEVLGFLGKEAAYRNIEVVVDIAPDVPSIRSDRSKMQQILLNIINNAFQAMTGGGRLMISAAQVGPDQVDIVIADNGPGIPEENRKKIFEPFFTTKRKTSGSGLGLSITYGLVKKLSGTIRADSAVG